MQLEIDHMLERIECTVPPGESRGALIMALEWVGHRPVSTSLGLEDWLALNLDDCDLAECSCQCHAESEPFNPDDNRYKWPEDRR